MALRNSPWAKEPVTRGWIPGWRQVGREASATRETLETCERDLGAAGLGVSKFGQRLPSAACLLCFLLVNLLCSVAEHPTHTPDLAFLLLLASV